jgi:Tfp pilus assembly protein PilZ
MKKIAFIKHLLIVTVFFFAVVTNYAQQSPKTKKPLSEWRAIYYVDSLEMPKGNSLFLGVDPNKIADIRVEKYVDSTKHIHGKIFITSKNPHRFYMLSMSDVAAMYGIETSKYMIYMVENTFIKNIETFRIDLDFLLKVEILKASEFEYLKDTIPDLTIFKIITRTKENVESIGRIRIRGTETAAKQ